MSDAYGDAVQRRSCEARLTNKLGRPLAGSHKAIVQSLLN